MNFRVGDKVNYYPVLRRDGTPDSAFKPINTIVRISPYKSSSGHEVCFVSAVRGYVLTSHLRHRDD